MVTSNPTSTSNPRPLTILIAGAGIGGLSAAIALRQAGHLVQIFERSLFNNEYGAAVSITPNANGVLQEFGLNLGDIGGVDAKKFTEYARDGTLIRSLDTAQIASGYKYSWQYIYRVDLHNGLKKIATSPDGAGTPVVIHLGQRAISVDPETATITLKDGTTHQGDVVIGADGINSALRPYIDLSNARPTSFGLTSYRFLIPASVLSSDPQTQRFTENDGELSLWGDTHRKILLYPCQGGDVLNCGCIMEDDHPEDKIDWDGTTCKNEILKEYKSFHPDAVALLNKVDATAIKVWPLYDLPALSTWVRGKAALLGDAAHPFLPFQGQGAAQAIEDGVTLGALLPLGTQPAEVQGRLELYMKARYERATYIQEVSRRGGKDTEEQIKKRNLAIKEVNDTFGHDARAFAKDLLEQSLVGKVAV